MDNPESEVPASKAAPRDYAGDDNAASAEDSLNKSRREIVLKHAKWAAPSMVALLLSSRPSAASQQRPNPPGF